MALISMGKLDKNQIPIIIGCVFSFLNRILNQYEGAQLLKNQILTNICIAISRFLTVFPYIILIIKNSQSKNNNNKDKALINTKINYIDQKRKAVTGKWIFIFLSSFTYLVQTFFFVFSFEIKTNAWIWNILFSSVFYYLIFKVKLYKHHILSIILIIIIGLIIDLVTNNLQTEIVDKTVLLLLKFLKEVIFSLHIVIAKYVMERKYVSVYELSFHIGVFNLIFLGAFVIIDYNYIGIDNYEDYFNNFNSTELLVVFGVILTQIGINLGTLFTAKNNSPCHVFIIFVFGQLAYYKNLKDDLILVIISLILILFLSLIFNEIIEINFCGLSHNLKRNIASRAESESFSNCDTLEVSEEDVIELKQNEMSDPKISDSSYRSYYL